MAYDLLFYFFYMALSNTFLPLPTPPAVLAAGILIGPLFAALIGGFANCLGATFDYWVGSKIPHADHRSEKFRKIRPVLNKFEKNAFFAIVIAGFTPFFFDPIRIAAGYVTYDIKKYWMAVFLGRTPRYYFLAWLGKDVWIILKEVVF